MLMSLKNVEITLKIFQQRMKLFNYIYIGLSILTISCSQKTITLTEDELPEDVFYLDNNMTPFSGKCVIYYSNSGTVKEELQFKDGIQDGPHISYYKSAQIKRKGIYKGGFMNGTWTMFGENGKKLYEVHYQNDTLTGIYKSWYPNGIPCKKGSYSQNKRTGEWIHYDESGMIVETEKL